MRYPLVLLVALLIGCGGEEDSTSPASDVAVGDTTPVEDAALTEDTALVEDASPTEDTQPAESSSCEALVTEIRKITERSSLRGAVIGVQTFDCPPIIEATGMGAPNVDLQTDDLLRVGSVTKTFTAAAILKLVDEGALSLEDTVNQYIDGIPNGELITIRQLLNHTSGLFDLLNDQEFMRAAAQDPITPISQETLIEVIIAHEPLAEPGVVARYNNSGYHLLGVILERATGEAADVVIRARVLEPLRLRRSFMEGVEPLDGPLSPGFNSQNDDVTGVLHPTLRWTAGAMVTTAADLLAWTVGLYGGELLSTESHTEMVSAPVEAGELRIGLGVMLREVEGVGAVYGHGGTVPGYHASILYAPEHHAAVAVIVNHADTDAGFIAEALIQAAVRNARPR